MRRATARGYAPHRPRRQRGYRLPEPRRTRHRIDGEDESIQAPRGWFGYGGRELAFRHQADERDYGVGAQILRHIGVTKMRLMSNNPVKRVGLEAYGLEVVENVPIEVKPNHTTNST